MSSNIVPCASIFPHIRHHNTQITEYNLLTTFKLYLITQLLLLLNSSEIKTNLAHSKP